MRTCDAFIVGGGIAGSVAALHLARAGMEVIFIEKEETPRHKACSGIQFKYLEKIIGARVPRDRLCNHQIRKVCVHWPGGKSITSPFSMLNFMRATFDAWLNDLAVAAGARFNDRCTYTGHEIDGGDMTVHVRHAGGDEDTWRARYLVDASGLNPVIRKRLRPTGFSKDTIGATVSYYVDGDARLDPRTLHQFWNVDWCDAMFAWIYTKTLDDGKDYWVVGTGCNDGRLKERQALFFDHVVKTYALDGTVVKKEGFATTMSISSKDRVWLGEGNVLMAGDAAGLVDQARGLGMDAAALSGRLAASAICSAAGEGRPAIEPYSRVMAGVVGQTRRNQEREISRFTTNEQLARHLRRGMVPTGLGLAAHAMLNAFRPLHRLVLLPP